MADGDVEPVWDQLARRVTKDLAGADFPATTRARHVRHLAAAREHLARMGKWLALSPHVVDVGSVTQAATAAKIGSADAAGFRVREAKRGAGP